MTRHLRATEDVKSGGQVSHVQGRQSACGQPSLPEAQPGALLSLPQRGGTQGWDTWGAPRQGPRLDKEAEPGASQAHDGPDAARGPQSCLHVNDPPETSVQVVSLFVQMTQYKNESDASIGSS